MAHTLPDYSTKYKMTKVFGNIDTAELAARLGSPVTWDRRGNVIFYDDFEVAAIGWYTGYSPAGGSVTLNTGHYRSGETSVKLKAPPSTDGYAEMQRAFSYTADPDLGMEVSFTTQGDGRSTLLSGWIYTGTTNTRFGVKYRKADEKLTYLNSSNSYSDLATGIKTYEQEYNFNVLKVVIDQDTGKYKRGIFNGVEYDMSSYAYYSTASASFPHILVIIRHRTNVNSVSPIYVDDFILTRGEI